MKKIGLVGGIGPASTVEYYLGIIERCHRVQSGLYETAMEKAGLTAIIPMDTDISIIGSLIYPNLENGIVIPDDKQKLIELAEKYISDENADSLLLGCTELSLAIKACDVSVPILDTTKIHIGEIYRQALVM